jgi:hypothetical protein
MAYADKRKTYLNNWQASTAAAGVEYDTTDALSGATRKSHDTRVATWDGTDFNKNPVQDGSYNVCMELTDKNETGNYSCFSFSKSPQGQSLTPSDKPSFGNISITWAPN